MVKDMTITIDPDPASGPAPLTVTFDGSQSYDQDEEGFEIVSCQWDFAKVQPPG